MEKGPESFFSMLTYLEQFLPPVIISVSLWIDFILHPKEDSTVFYPHDAD